MVDCCETLVTCLVIYSGSASTLAIIEQILLFFCFFFFNPCSVLSGVVQCFLSVSTLDFDADIDLDLKAMISNVLHFTLFISNISFLEWCKMKGENKGEKIEKKKSRCCQGWDLWPSDFYPLCRACEALKFCIGIYLIVIYTCAIDLLPCHLLVNWPVYKLCFNQVLLLSQFWHQQELFINSSAFYTAFHLIRGFYQHFFPFSG